MKLIFYTSKNWLPEATNHVPMLFPFWGKINDPENSPDFGRFDELTASGKAFLALTNIVEEADIILLPFEYKFDQWPGIYEEIQSVSLKSGIPVLIFYNNDSARDIEFPNALILRTSLYSSGKQANVFAMPGWSMDFRKKITPGLFLRTKTPVPTVAYCGYVDYINFRQYVKKIGLMNYIKIRLKGVELAGEGTRLRGKAVRILSSCKSVTTKFILREGFWASDISDKKAARQEYIDTIVQADYAIIARGGGNFSYRLYEVMSCGRIPVFINTDCVLPFEDFVQWKKKFVWVERKAINNIGSIIHQFHAALTKDEFIARQKEIRDLYEEWISPVGFHKNLHQIVWMYKKQQKELLPIRR